MKFPLSVETDKALRRHMLMLVGYWYREIYDGGDPPTPEPDWMHEILEALTEHVPPGRYHALARDKVRYDACAYYDEEIMLRHEEELREDEA